MSAKEILPLLGKEHPLYLPKINLIGKEDVFLRGRILAKAGFSELKPGYTLDRIVSNAPSTAEHIFVNFNK